MGGPSKFTQSLEVIEHKRAKERTMKIRLNAAWTGAVDGIHVMTYPAGSEQDFPERIAAVLLQDGRAGLPEAAKAIPGAPENKMALGPGENKAVAQAGPVRKTGQSAKPKTPKAKV